MNTLDVLILLVLAGGLVRGLSTGIVRQVAGLVGLLLAFVLSIKLMGPVGSLITGSLDLSPRIAPFVGFVTVFLVIQIVVLFVIRSVEALIGALQLTAVNRALGGALGVVKAALVLSVAFLLLGYLGVPGPQTKEKSTLYSPVAAALPRAWEAVSGALPEVRRLTRGMDRPADPKGGR
jgi:membrane protein required for colicin V production